MRIDEETWLGGKVGRSRGKQCGRSRGVGASLQTIPLSMRLTNRLVATAASSCSPLIVFPCIALYPPDMLYRR